MPQCTPIQLMLTKVVGVAVGIFLIDQVSKMLAGTMFPGVVQLNAGISFGWFASNQVTLILVLLAVLLAVLFLSFRQIWAKQPLLAGVFIGAVASNVFDRLVWGGVRHWFP